MKKKVIAIAVFALLILGICNITNAEDLDELQAQRDELQEQIDE